MQELIQSKSLIYELIYGVQLYVCDVHWHYIGVDVVTKRSLFASLVFLLIGSLFSFFVLLLIVSFAFIWFFGTRSRIWHIGRILRTWWLIGNQFYVQSLLLLVGSVWIIILHNRGISLMIKLLVGRLVVKGLLLLHHMRWHRLLILLMHIGRILLLLILVAVIDHVLVRVEAALALVH